jgi:hypothetical protein
MLDTQCPICEGDHGDNTECQRNFNAEYEAYLDGELV